MANDKDQKENRIAELELRLEEAKSTIDLLANQSRAATPLPATRVPQEFDTKQDKETGTYTAYIKGE